MKAHKLIKDSTIDPHSEDSRRRVTAMVMKLFEKWRIDTKTQLQLLGMKESSRAVLSNYKQGRRIIPDDPDKLNRVGLLLSIHKCLRLLFPENPKLVETWVLRKNKILANEAPLDIMKQHGLFGIAKVARYLEFELIH